jgi:predicted  nucleic acid-binding Zn-ribbon protein
MFCTAERTIVTRSPHQCTWCGQTIAKGEPHVMWKSIEDSWFTSRMHPECHDALDEEQRFSSDSEYVPYDNERPSTAPRSLDGATPGGKA